MMVQSFDILLVDGRGSKFVNGSLRRRIALRIDEKDVDVVAITLDSDQSRSRQSKRWAQDYVLDASDIEERRIVPDELAPEQTAHAAVPSARRLRNSMSP